MTLETSSNETMVFDESKGINYAEQLESGSDSFGEEDGYEPISLTVDDHGRYKELTGPSGVFGAFVPSSWSTKARRFYDEDDSACYLLIAAPDVEEFEDEWKATGIMMVSYPLFDGYVSNRQSIDALLDMLSPEEDGSRDYITTGIIWKKTRMGVETWVVDDDCYLRLVAGPAADERWLYLLYIQGLTMDRTSSTGEIIDERLQERLVNSIFE